MSKYIVSIVYRWNGKELTERFAARAKSRQHVKEQYHRYTHENYESVGRQDEDEHFHHLGDNLTCELREITPADGNDLIGLTPIKRH